MKPNYWLLAGVVFFFGGCANYASFQTADTVDEGDIKVGVGGTYSQYTVDIGDSPQSVGVPALAVWGRYGITDDIEAHANVWMPLGASVGGKYQILGNRKTPGFSLSAGADVGYLSLSSGEGDNKVSSTIIDLYVPLYTGYRVSPSFAAYFTPKYILRTGISSAEGSEAGFAHNPAATLGVAFGEDVQILGEGTVAYELESELTAFTFGLGVAF